MIRKSRKRHFTLLEVMISFIIILIAFYPLISPHAAILREQRFFIDKIELDHLVSLVYADVIEGLYQNRFEWKDVKEGTKFKVDKEFLTRIGYDKKLPYAGTFSFGVEKYKPKIKPEDPPEEKIKFFVYLLNLKFDFKHKYNKAEKGEKESYKYQITVIRDMEHGTGFMERGE